MLRILYSDLHKIINNRGFKFSMILALVYPLIGTAILALVVRYVGGEIAGEDAMVGYSSIGALLVTASVLYVTIPDFADGIVRNKLINGAKRRDIMLSAIIGGMFAGVMTAIACAVGEIASVFIFTKGFEVLSYADAAEYVLALTLASMSVGAFSAMLVMVFGGSNFAYIPGFAFAFFFKVMGMEVADKLYPDGGITTLTGTKLKVYTLYDRFVPYAHFTEYLRWDLASYILGAVILTALSCIIGVMVFNKKEIR